jgi:hypothetical protein
MLYIVCVSKQHHTPLERKLEQLFPACIFAIQIVFKLVFNSHLKILYINAYNKV